MTTLALAGNPNCGKTTLFNALTGRHQRVGNWPGVTVERKSGAVTWQGESLEIVDLPGTYSLDQVGDGIDEQIARTFLAGDEADMVINVLDASCLSRGLYLTNQLADSGVPMVVALNMTDVAESQGVSIDAPALSERLGCPVVPIIASKGEGIRQVMAALANAAPGVVIAQGDQAAIYSALDEIAGSVTTAAQPAQTPSERIDNLILNKYLAFPIFLAVMYLMFLFSINVGSAFIDFFDLLAAAIFVELPRTLLTGIGLNEWLTVFIADGVGGGIQLVATFIPVIGALFLALSFLEDSGYMARVAFIVDRMLRSLGLPGKSFVPLIVGFGCNVPAVMATRALDTGPDRILTTLMAPYMSCGARLTVYALFAAAFFPSNGQNVVFALYLIGIAVAVLSALAVKKHLLPESRSHFIAELPAYHVPIAKNILIQTWQRLKSFIVRAGKAIVLVVVVLNVVNSIGTDGSVGNENTDKSVLSAIGKAITPAFAPMGIEEDNWPATVGIFTGLFAKEVVVGTLDALYAQDTGDDDATPMSLIGDALQSVPDNLSDLGNQILDPLGINLGDLEDLEAQAESQAVKVNTLTAMQGLFDGASGAFAYLLFILLYAPCVATIGVIYKEIGGFWAAFSMLWSLVVAYAVAVMAYQIPLLATSTASAAGWILAVSAVSFGLFAGLIFWGKQAPRHDLIPAKILD